ncbi:MAG: TIGR02677 family protein [Leifsonia sp.]
MTTNLAEPAYGAFNHVTAPNSALYRRLLGVFVDAKERFQVHLRPDDVQHELRRDEGPPVDVDTVTKALETLVEWGNLISSPDTGRVTVVEDFYRKRQLFQLSHSGEAVERALRAYDEALGRRGALQAVALEDIAVGLAELLTLIDAPELDLGKVQQSLSALTARFNDLADNASAFMASLQRTIDLTDTDESVFAAYKTRLIEYLERFIHDLAVRGPNIASLLLQADADRVDHALWQLAERDAASVAPDADDVNALTESERLHEMWANRWSGLCGWFLTTNGRDSQAKLLRLSALAAIPSLLDVVRAVNARRSGRSDRSSDYLRLAQWFQEAETDDDRHRLARATFGLYSTRHLTVDPDTWQEWQERSGLVGVEWAEAPPVHISPQLRRTGSYERRGRANQVIDRSADRAMLALKVEREAAQIAQARRKLATHGEVELASLASLDTVSFGLFLTLLGDALVSKQPGESGVSTLSSDGTMRIDLTPLPGDETKIVAIETDRGTLYGPNHLVRIQDLDATPAPASAPALASAPAPALAPTRIGARS